MISAKHYPVNVQTTGFGTVRPQNNTRKYLLVQNKDATNFLTLVFGAATALVAQIQKIVFSNTPTAGTFKLTLNGSSTSALAFNASAATIQTAVRTLPGCASATVSGSVSATGLTVTLTGYVDPTNYGPEAPLIAVTASSLAIAQVTQVQTISFSGVPASGALVISFGGQSTSALAFSATQGQIQTALRGLPGLGSVTVVGTMATTLVVTMTGTVGDNALFTFGTNTLQTSAPAAVTPSTADTTPGVAPATTTSTVTETTPGTLVNGIVIPAGGAFEWDDPNCPLDPVLLQADTAAIVAEVVEG